MKFFVEMKAIGYKRPMQKGKQRFDPKVYSEFKQMLRFEVSKLMKRTAVSSEPLIGKVYVGIHIFKKQRGVTKPQWGDLDNFVKSILDALQGVCYQNDAQIVELTASKHESNSDYISIEILPVKED